MFRSYVFPSENEWEFTDICIGDDEEWQRIALIQRRWFGLIKNTPISSVMAIMLLFIPEFLIGNGK